MEGYFWIFLVKFYHPMALDFFFYNWVQPIRNLECPPLDPASLQLVMDALNATYAKNHTVADFFESIEYSKAKDPSKWYIGSNLAPFTAHDVQQAAQLFSNKKSPGFDQINAQILKSLPEK